MPASPPLAAIVSAALATALVVAACGNNGSAGAPSGTSAKASASTLATGVAPATPAAPPPPGAREGASVAVAPEGDVVFVADEDHAAIDVITLPVRDETKATHIDAPGRPAQIVVLGRTVIVTVREVKEGGGGAIVVYARGDGPKSTELKEQGRVRVPADAWGLAVSPDGTTAAVSSAWAHQVSIVDLAEKKVLASRDVAREPRGLAFDASGNEVFVSHLMGATLTRIDHVRGDAKVVRVALPASPARSPAAEKLEASLGYALVMSPDRKRLFAPRHALGTVGSRAWFGSAAIDTLDATTSKPIATARGVNAHVEIVRQPTFQGGPSLDTIARYAEAAATGPERGEADFAVPHGAVYRKRSRSILVASEGTGTLLEFDATMSDPTLGRMQTYGLTSDVDQLYAVPAHGGAPSGVALSPDESVAYVHCRSTDELAVVPLATWEGAAASAPPRFVKLADDPSDIAYLRGRRLFYIANDERLSGGMSCAGCHPEGRDDGHVWHEVSFDTVGERVATFDNLIATSSAARHLASYWDNHETKGAKNVDANGAGYARQTPMLVGRVNAEGPYGWLGKNTDLLARLARGFDLHRWGSNGDHPDAAALARGRTIITFVRTGLVPPPVDSHPLTDEERKGKELFASDKTECATCHTPQTDYTNRTIVKIAAPGPMPGFVDEPDQIFKVPSLIGVGGTPPYFHDGRFDTLEELVDKNLDRMGKTTQLSAEEKKALVAFLKTL